MASMDDSTIAEPGVPDAAMLDNIDDLFGETADGMPSDDIGVAMSSVPPPMELLIRCAEMQNLGCCTKLAWSLTGSIAQVSEDGHKIDFRALRRSHKSGEWSLTESSKFPIVAPTGTKWQHIEFDGIGIDLAAVDTAGTVHVHTLLGALGRMPEALSKIDLLEGSIADVDVVVGLRWLPVWPTEFKIPHISAATKSQKGWTTFMSSRSPDGPKMHHAAESRHALLYVSRRAKLTLMYQNEVTWHSISIDMESASLNSQTLTHATMCEDKDSLLLLTHDTDRRFRLYRVSVAWNPTQSSRPGGPPVTIVAPALTVAHLFVLEDVAAQQADAVHLTHLRLIPAAQYQGQSPPHPSIIATFTHATSPVVQPLQPSTLFTLIGRWQIEILTAPAIHPSFGKTKATATPSFRSSHVTLQRQVDIVIPKIVLSIEPQFYNSIISFPASDGTIELRDCMMMNVIEASFDSMTAANLPQCGFEQMPLLSEHAIHIAPSPDATAMIYLRADHTPSIKFMTFRYSWQPLDSGLGDTRGLIEAAVVCLARQYAILCCRSAASDEILALIPRDLDNDLRLLFVRQIHRMMGRTLDIATQENARQQVYVLKEVLLPRIVSAAFIVGLGPGVPETRTLMNRFASAFLNMRATCLSLVPIASRPEATRPELLCSIRGLIKYSIDLLAYFVDSLMTIRRSSPAGQPITIDMIDKYVKDEDDLAIYLILQSFTRTYLKYFALLVPKLLALTQKMLPHARSIEERQQMAEIVRYHAALPVRLVPLEALINEMDGAIRMTYSNSNITADRRAEIETHLLCGIHGVPGELSTPLTILFESALPKMSASVDQARLHCWDTEWLGLGGDASWRAWRQYDANKKLPLTKGVALRVCRRCGCQMEDVPPEKVRDMPFWLAHSLRYCICMNYWILL